MEFSISDHCDKEPIKESILLSPFLIFLFKHKYHNRCHFGEENKNMVLD